MEFKSLQHLYEVFKDDEACKEYLIQKRWGGNIECPFCGSRKFYNVNGGKGFKCGSCRKNFSATVGTVYENNKVGLRTLFAAEYLIFESKNKISSCQLARDLGITQKSAWYMLNRIKNADQTIIYQRTDDDEIVVSEVDILEECKKLVKELDKNLPTYSETFKAGVVVMYGSVSGKHDVNNIVHATGYQSSFVFFLCNNLITNEVWKNGKAYFEYLFTDKATDLERSIDFWLTVALAKGEVVRHKHKWGIDKK